ncbi:uncharacterized protein LOC123672400 [Harmonia axyridis]|uniref:uncharacterized protein LOC123672400 n=1 Tax=Harmonia axyridis TaxID=115357 RepID=UPI001E2773D6|nr:uncharacterized protein LOC123672400 [Harmonia axyridis]
MSDMAECFFNGWLEVMGEGNASYPQHLFCSWHVDRAWQSNLTKISDREKRSEIYKILKTLQRETPLLQFTSALTNALTYICNNEKTRNFGEYFKKNYAYNFRKWAYCFRVEAGINTNMHLESMHKVIKYFYLERKTVKRLDEGLIAVLKYVRDKSVERIIRLTKGEHTKQTRFLSQNHKEVLKHIDNYIIETNNYNISWTIKKNEQTSYTIYRLLDIKCCEQICLFCEVCTRMFSCECKFYLENRTMCKHIHMLINKLQTENKLETVPDFRVDNISTELLALSEKPNSSNKKIKDIKDLASKFESLDFEKFDDETINKIHHHLIIAKNITSCSNFPNDINDNTKFQLRNESNKRLIESHIRLTSTKNNA